MTTDRAAIEEAYVDLDALHARLTTFDYTGLTAPELLELLSRREVLVRSAPMVDHALLAALQTPSTATQIGGEKLGRCTAAAATYLGHRSPPSGA